MTKIGDKNKEWLENDEEFGENGEESVSRWPWHHSANQPRRTLGQGDNRTNAAWEDRRGQP